MGIVETQTMSQQDAGGGRNPFYHDITPYWGHTSADGNAGGADVMVLDGEAQPAGGMGVCRQAKDEIHDCPPVLLIIGRPDDGWLATWSGAEAVVSHPIEPRALATALAGLMRERAGRAAAQA